VNVGNAGNWSDVSPPGSFWRIEIAVAPSSAGAIYAVCQGNGSNEVSDIFSSTTSGSSWTPRIVPTIYDQGNYPLFTRSQSWYDLACAVDPNSSTTLYIGGVDLLKSTNSGATWTQLTSWSLWDDYSLVPFPFFGGQNIHADVHAFVFKPGSSTTALVGCDGGVYYSSNLNVGVGLPSWTDRNSGYNVTQYYSCATHPTNANYYLAGAQDNGTHKFTAAGVNTGIEVTGGDGAYCFIDKTNGNNQITSYVNNNYYYSTDGGGSFNSVNGGSGSGRFINPSDLDGTNDILYSAGGNDQLVRWSSIFGTSTRTNLTMSLNGNQISAVKVSPNTPTTVYVGTNKGRIYRITNANAIPAVTLLTSSPLVTDGYVNSIDIVKRPTNTDDSIVVAISNYGVNSVWFTSNGTSATPTWTDIDDNTTLQDIPVRCALFSPANSNIIFIATEVGVMATANVSGNSTPWTLINNSQLPNVRVDMLKTNLNNELVAATHGRGLWTSASITPLALRLIDFNAKLVKDKVELEWEVNNDREAKMYTVERMYAGEQFQTIASIPPAGKALYRTSDGSFSATHESIYYRLKTEDVKGEILYSASKQIKVSSPDKFVEQIYPSVSNGTVNIKVGHADLKQMKIQLYDALGRIKMNQLVTYASGVVDLNEYTKGAYLIIITSPDGNQKFSSQVILQ
jgi:hypothetical protein